MQIPDFYRQDGDVYSFEDTLVLPTCENTSNTGQDFLVKVLPEGLLLINFNYVLI